MGLIELKQGETVKTNGCFVYLIIKGCLTMSCKGCRLPLEKGDAAGVLEILHGKSLFSYEAREAVTLASYSVSTIESLEAALFANNDLIKYFYASAIKQISSLINSYEMMQFDCTSSVRALEDHYKSYVLLCHKYHQKPHSIGSLDKLKAMSSSNARESWLSPYCDALTVVSSDEPPALFTGSSWLAAAFFYHLSRDITGLLESLDSLFVCQEEINQLYLNSTHKDLLSFLTSLLSVAEPESEDFATLHSDIRFLLTTLEMNNSVSLELISERIREFEDKLLPLQHQQAAPEVRLEEVPAPTAEPDVSVILKDSLSQVLSYSGLDSKMQNAFKEYVSAYFSLHDRASSDDAARRLCKKIAEQFLILYKAVALKSLTASELPVVIRMFLCFGYLDEALAGAENAEQLYQICLTMSPHAQGHVYTLFDWLTAIYKGEKEPSRNEFDEEYADTVHAQKLKGNLTPAEEKELLTSPLKKVEYELDHMFPQVNKMTYGRITSYCPLFSEHNAIRSPKQTYVSEEKIEAGINRIRNIDFSAFYRETIYSNESVGLPKEFIHVEALPDIILMPNMGTRGAMWQEIENRRRTTSSRMMLPVFYLDDLDQALILLTGQYRWEICKRIQGARWNDLTEFSLTSEYFDYIQFHRKNSDLSADAKEKIKLSLQKTKNSYKEMFVQDYLQWILYEGTGSPRLNKVARNILFTYCPFALNIRQSLSTNPMFRELLDRYNIKNAQRQHHMDIIRQKLSNSGNTLPEEILAECEYLQK